MDALSTLAIPGRAPEPPKPQRSARALAWSRLQREHPDHASVISAISAGFGRPARVVVRAGDETLLDSETLR